MSRIGKLPIQIPDTITVKFEEDTLIVENNKGRLKFTPHPRIQVVIEGKNITIIPENDNKECKSLHGLTRTIVANMIEGVNKGFEKKLEIRGVGYRAQTQDNKLILSLGFSHPIEYTIPEGITIEIDKEKKNILTISGIDKQLVGQVAAEIRAYRKPEPYKGKGVRYVGEHVQQKAGKTAAGSKE